MAGSPDSRNGCIMPFGEMKRKLGQYASMINEYLADWLNRTYASARHELHDAMSYSLLCGGKKIRPALCLAWGEVGGLNPRLILPFAAAIEMIHTYSLIHDDLPAMDNSDMRRGQPSCHKKYGEGIAILAGDALLADAFNLASLAECEPDRTLAAIRVLAGAAGSAGMCLGQALDISLSRSQDISAGTLVMMEEKKTGEMFSASCKCGAILAGSSPWMQNHAAEYGMHLGMAFQIYDDILDRIGDSQSMGKPGGLDSANDRMTMAEKFGMEESVKRAEHAVELGLSAISDITEVTSSFLRALIIYTINRKS